MTEHVWRDHVWDMDVIHDYNGKNRYWAMRNPGKDECKCFVCRGAKAKQCIHCGAVWYSEDGSFDRKGIYSEMSCEEYTVYMKKKRMDDALS